MEKITIIAQIMGIMAMAFNILSYQRKTRGGAIAFQLVGGLLFSVHFFLFGAFVGGVLNAVAFIRAIVFLNKEKLHADHIYWLVGFIIVYIASYILNFTAFGKEPTMFNFVIELLPVIGMIATTISFRYSDAKTIRRYGLISSPSWLVYNITTGSIGAIACEVFSLCSIVIGIVRFDLKRKTR